MTNSLKKIKFSRPYPYSEAYKPGSLRLRNGCLAAVHVFIGLWILLCIVFFFVADGDSRVGVFFFEVFFSFFVFGVFGLARSIVTQSRDETEAKLKQIHLDELQQAKDRKILVQELDGESATNTTILFLAANPMDTTVLRLDGEAREIREELERRGLRNKFFFEVRGAVRPKDLGRTLIELSPRYLHFSGHGGPSGAIFLEDDVGMSKPVSAGALRAAFEASGDHIHCVVLNACYSSEQADEILTCVPFVIGMTDSIGDEAAVAFSRGFYRGIGDGREVPKAFAMGIAEMKMEGQEDASAPVLLPLQPVSSDPVVPKAGPRPGFWSLLIRRRIREGG